jgi:hypothetical protein
MYCLVRAVAHCRVNRGTEEILRALLIVSFRPSRIGLSR